MRLLFLLLFLPFISFAQNQKLAESNCESWIKIRMQEDTLTYHSIFFKSLEPITALSEQGAKEIKQIKFEKYQLMQDALATKITIDEYQTAFKSLNARLSTTRTSSSDRTGYKLIHKFTTKDLEGFQIQYKVKYELDIDLKVIESSVSRKVDRANSNL